MPTTSEIADRVPGSGIREIVNLVVGRGGDVARLEIGEPGFPTPAHVIEAGHQAALRGAGYTQSAGLWRLRQALSAKLARVNGQDVPADQVVVTQGAVQGCALVLAALLAPGDEVLVPDPAWPNYEMLIRLHGAVPVRYPLRTEEGYLPLAGEVRALVTPRTRLLIVNSPANPTGAVFPAELVRALVAVAADHDLVLLSDEAYDELVFEGEAAGAARYDPERVVGVYSFSKTYAMTGWRVGYVAAPGWLAPTLVRLQEPLISCVSEVTQAGALAALEGPQGCVAEMRAAYRQRRDLVVGLLQAAGIAVQVPHGAFYLMLPFAPGADSRLAALELVDHGVAVAPGSAFGAQAASQARLSLGAREEVLRRGIERLLGWYRASGGGARPAAARRGA